MNVLFTIGSLKIHFFGVMIAIGAVAGILIALWLARKRGLPVDKILELQIYGLIGGIVGARLIYLVFYNPLFYLNNPMQILMVQNGGLSIHGGIIGGTLAAIFYIRRHKLPLWEVADVMAPALILGQAVGRIGCDVFGVPMKMFYPWGVRVDGILVHPVQIYESILNYLFFIYLWIKKDRIRYHGQLFVQYLVGYAIIRGVIEFWRINPAIAGLFTVSHLLSLTFIIAGLVLSHLLSQKNAVSVQKSSTRPLLAVLLVTIGILASLVLYYTVQQNPNI